MNMRKTIPIVLTVILATICFRMSLVGRAPFLQQQRVDMQQIKNTLRELTMNEASLKSAQTIAALLTQLSRLPESASTSYATLIKEVSDKAKQLSEMQQKYLEKLNESTAELNRLGIQKLYDALKLVEIYRDRMRDPQAYKDLYAYGIERLAMLLNRLTTYVVESQSLEELKAIHNAIQLIREVTPHKTSAYQLLGEQVRGLLWQPTEMR